MRHIGRTMIALVFIVWASTCQAGSWGLGTNLGLSILSFEDQGADATTVSWPGDALLAHEPGLRVSFAGEGRAHELFIDTGMMLASQTGFTVHTLLLTGNYQYNLRPASTTSPYLTVGGGLVNEGTDVDTSTLPSLGGGLGLQFRVAGGYGTIRSELHFNHLGGDESHGVSSVNAFGLKLGFDLWMKP